MESRLIIAGGRDFDNYKFLEFEVKKFVVEEIKTRKNLEIVSGTASGADRLGERFAEKFAIALKRFPANWDRDGKAAGHIRNEEMAKYARNQFCIVFWDGSSRGTKNMIENCKKYNLNFRIVRY